MDNVCVWLTRYTGASFQFDNRGGKVPAPKARTEAPKAPRGVGCGEGVPPSPQKIFLFLNLKWCSLVNSEALKLQLSLTIYARLNTLFYVCNICIFRYR